MEIIPIPDKKSIPVLNSAEKFDQTCNSGFDFDFFFENFHTALINN